MAKKLGKFLLFTAAVSTVAATCYFLNKKKHENDIPEDDDYDDFGKEVDTVSEEPRNYVPLNKETASDDTSKTEENSSDSEDQNAFTPLKETLAQSQENSQETVEEFFDEDDTSDEEPPINDN